MVIPRLGSHPRGVYSDMYHTYVGSGHFLGFRILNFNILGVFRKKIGGMKIL